MSERELPRKEHSPHKLDTGSSPQEGPDPLSWLKGATSPRSRQGEGFTLEPGMIARVASTEPTGRYVPTSSPRSPRDRA